MKGSPARRLQDTADPQFVADVLEGLGQPQKTIPSLWLYDFRGSELFEEITHLEEYYPTRTEIGILRDCAPAVARHIGPGATVVEIGSGSSRKTPLLLSAMPALRGYVPIDISAGFLHESVASLREQLPHVRCHPVVADFTQPEQLRAVDAALPATGARAGFFPGSTIGNFTPEVATRLLHQFGAMLGPGSWFVVGVDSTRDPDILVPAYDDARGVTAEFNRNLLARMNDELGADFPLGEFRHEARFNARHGRMEMHLVCDRDVDVSVAGRRFHFRPGESLHTENSYKYTVDEFGAMARASGWHPVERYTDTAGRFGLFLLRRDH